jgi:signal peptidase II
MSTGPVSTSRALRLWLLFGAIALVVIALDQASKAWVVSSFALVSGNAAPGSSAAPTPVLGDLVRIARSENDGGIFGMLGNSATILGIASLAVIAVIVWVEARQGVHSLLLTIALGLLLGGAVGNLLDRLRYGHVVDWVDTGIGDARFYTFNVADSAISIAVALLILIGILGPRLHRSANSAGTQAGVDHQIPNGGHP